MSRLKHFGQLASHRSKNTGLFTNFSQQASSIIKKGDKNLHRCIDKADISLTLGDLVVCNYRAILAGWDMQEKLWKRVDINFSKINNQLRRSFRSNSRSSDSSITDLWKKNQALHKESNAQKKLINRQVDLISRQSDLITGLEQRVTSLELSNSQGIKHPKPKNIISNRRRKERIAEIELTEVELNPVLLGNESQAQGLEAISIDNLIGDLNDLGIN